MTRLPAFALQDRLLTADALRVFGYAATAGQRGIASPTDFKVEAIGSSSVRVNPGGAVMPTRFVSSPAYQSYAVAMDAAEDVAIPATGSGGGATRYIIARIHDEQFGGGPAPAPNWTLEVVSSITSLPYPFVEFAKINQPPSTSIITAAMIEDLRKIANPRRERHTEILPVTVQTDVNSSTWIRFPDPYFNVVTPWWANKLIVRADLLSIINGGGANVDGRFLIRYGGSNIESASRRWDVTWNGSTERHDFTVAAELDISARAGLESTIQVRARRIGGTGWLRADTQSELVVDYEFIEDIA